MVIDFIRNKKNNLFLTFIFIFFSTIYCLISLLNHYNFRTNAWDLGLFNNAIYDYMHFQWNDCSLLCPGKVTNTLADHFSLLPMIFSPFYWIFGSYTLLIIQIASILWGGLGIYYLVMFITKNEILSQLAVIHFFCIWGIYSALGFDYHDNVVASMFVPWFIYYIYKEKLKSAGLYLLLLLVSKENMALWIVFICIGLIFIFYRQKKKLFFILFSMLFSVIYFYLIINVVIPSISSQGRYLHFNYKSLGNNMEEALCTILTRPLYVFSLLFNSYSTDQAYWGIKSELHYVVLLSGGFALLFKPQYLLMLLPVYAQKLFNDDFNKWGLNVQYSIEFAPIIVIAVYHFIQDLNAKMKYKYLICLCILFSTMLITYKKLQNRESKWYNKEANNFFIKDHYRRNFDVRNVHKKINSLPKNVKVSAQSSLCPHLCFRKTIYQFPYIGDADYIVLLPEEINTYPLNNKDYKEKVAELINSKEWTRFYQNKDLLIFMRIAIFKQYLNNPINKESQINYYIKLIKQDSSWYNFVINKRLNNESIETSLRNNALWIIEQELNKNK